MRFSPQSRVGRREGIFSLAGDAAKQKGFYPSNAECIIGAMATKGVRSFSRRDGVSASIAVSRLKQKKDLPLRSPRLSGEASA